MADDNQTSLAQGHDVELLWPDGAPGSLGDGEPDKPTMTVFLAPREKSVGAGVVIFPGGGYVNCSMEKEGYKPALWFNSLGISAFVVRYRTNNTAGTSYCHPIPLQDARRAVRIVRSRATQYGIKEGRLGVMGYSAGGHLAASLATHWQDKIEDAADNLAPAFSTHADFLMLIYPVITMRDSFTHAGSRKSLLGAFPPAKVVDEWSNERKVTGETPPTFLVTTSEDKSVPSENAVEFYLSLRKWRVPGELHVYEKGPHGFGMNPGFGPASAWPDRLEAWLRTRSII